MKWLALFTLALLFFGCSSEEEAKEKAQKNKEAFSKVARFQKATGLVSIPGQEGILVLGENKVFLWDGYRAQTWLDLSSRSSQIWDLSFSPNWQLDQTFFVYYQNRAGGSVVAEGIGSEAAEWRRTVLQLPPASGGSLLADKDLLFITTPRQLLRINPYLEDGAAYSVPSDNPRREETWLVLPEGKWSADFLGQDLIIWGEEQSLLWQEASSQLRGSSLKPKDSSWQGKCPLAGGFRDGEGFLFADACSGDILKWQDEKMKPVRESVPGVIAIAKSSLGTWALLDTGELLLKE